MLPEVLSGHSGHKDGFRRRVNGLGDNVCKL